MSEKMRSFLSESTIRVHKEYLSNLHLRYSVLKKSEPRLSDVPLDKIHRLNLKYDIKREAVMLLSEIKAHEIYFSSFSADCGKYEKIKKKYLSADSLRYEILRTARCASFGFLFVLLERGAVRIITRETPPYFTREVPALALDLCEHAYLLDYGFHRDEYLRCAVGYLDLSKIEEYLQND